MQKTLLAIAIALHCSAPVVAQEETINKYAHLSALVESERAPRSWKTLKLWPGKVTLYHYKWIMPDGSKVEKLETVKIKGVPDKRPLSDSHPNLAIAVPSLEIVGNTFGTLIAGYIHK